MTVRQHNRSAPWWQTAVFYQIYPRSFADGNGDGIGDIPGIIDRLDYLAELGVDAVWLSPHYPSPLFDCGYDIADYTGVAPEYGTLDDFRRLLDGIHARGMRLILDLVLNHTSDEHPWFQESRSSRDNPKRDWYVWRDGRNGGPPNNWYSTFGGPAWTLDPATGQYYYHFFFNRQPDLNWRNPEVRAAMYGAARFWLDMGVDGFRLDAIGTLFEDPSYEDHAAELTQEELTVAMHLATDPDDRARLQAQYQEMFRRQADLPEMHEVLKELRALANQYPDRMLIGESDEIAYLGNGTDELHLVFNFPLMRTKCLTPKWVLENQRKRLAALPPGAWPCNTLGNHDTGRIYSHFADGRHDDAWAKLALAVVLTLKGTPFLYNGEEIGMTDLILDDMSKFRDMLGVWIYDMARRTAGADPEMATFLAASNSRDRNRTPMQWSGAPNGGFSPAGVCSWLPVNPNHSAGVNVEDQAGRSDSMLSFYRALIAARRNTPALVLGDFRPLRSGRRRVLAFVRRDSVSGQACLVAMNMGTRSAAPVLRLSGEWRCIFSTHRKAGEMMETAGFRLAPFEVFIAEEP